jgi:hypothetical protein
MGLLLPSKPGVQCRVSVSHSFRTLIVVQRRVRLSPMRRMQLRRPSPYRTIKRTIDQPTTRPPSELGQHDVQFLRLCFHAYPAQLPNPLEECARCTFLCGDVRTFSFAFLNVRIDFHRRSPDLNPDGDIDTCMTTSTDLTTSWHRPAACCQLGRVSFRGVDREHGIWLKRNSRFPIIRRRPLMVFATFW